MSPTSQLHAGSVLIKGGRHVELAHPPSLLSIPSLPTSSPYTPPTSTHLSKGQTLRLTSTVVRTRMTSTCQSLLVRASVGVERDRVLQGANSTASVVSEHESLLPARMASEAR